MGILFGRIRTLLFACFFLSLIGGGFWGYFLHGASEYKGHLEFAARDFEQLRKDIETIGLARLKKVFEPEDRDELFAVVERMGVEDAKTFWEQSHSYIFGQQYLAYLLARRSDSAVVTQPSSSETPFTLELEGIVLNKDKTRCVMYLKVNGTPALWAWKFESGEWRTASTPSGMGTRNVKISMTSIEFEVFYIADGKSIGSYTFDPGSKYSLEQFKTRVEPNDADYNQNNGIRQPAVESGGRSGSDGKRK